MTSNTLVSGIRRSSRGLRRWSTQCSIRLIAAQRSARGLNRGAEPNIPVKAPAEEPKAPQVESPLAPRAETQTGPAEPGRSVPPVEAPKAAPIESAPAIEGWGGPAAQPFGPQPIHPPGSIHHPFPVLGEDDPMENPRDFEGHS